MLRASTPPNLQAYSRPINDGPLGWKTKIDLETDIANLKAAMQASSAREAFMPSVSVSQVLFMIPTTYYKSDEEYLEAIAEALRASRQTLVLLPEIALSSQWLSRFQRRFGVAPAVWHSDLTSRTRRTTWRAVADGKASVVVGARSALFLPFPDLGCVIVDEERGYTG